MIQTFNNILTKIFDIILYPFSLIGDFAQIFIVSLCSSFIILFFFKKLSSAEKKKEAKNKIKANIFAIRIYKDFWQVIIKSFFKSIFYTLKYFTQNFAPVLVFLPILFLFSVQLDVRLGLRPFNAGEEFIVSVTLKQSPHELTINQQSSEHFAANMPPVYIDSMDEKQRDVKEINYRMIAKKEGIGQLNMTMNGFTVSKTIAIGQQKTMALSNRKFSGDILFLNSFIYPVDKIIPDNEYLSEIFIKYPPRTVKFLFLNTHWLVYYILFIFIVVLSLKNRFGVEF